MEIHFCDLCNESVPEADLALGRAVRRAGRVICPVCERAMSSHGEAARASQGERGLPISSHREPAAAASANGNRAGHGTAAAQQAPGRSSSGVFLGIAALLFAVGAAALFAAEMNSDRVEREEVQAVQDREVAGVARRQVALEQRLGAEREALELALQARVDTQAATAGQALARVEGRLGDLESALVRVEGALATIGEDVARGSEDTGRRLDELAGRLATQRDEQRRLQLELTDLGVAVAAGAAAAPLVPEAPFAPAWNERVADLASTDASLRYYAVIDLAATGDPAVVPHLTPLLADNDLFVQMATARVLGELGSPAAIEPLIGALEDPEDAVRETAVLALRALSGRNFRFDPFANPAERARRVTAWREWWEKAKSDYL